MLYQSPLFEYFFFKYMFLILIDLSVLLVNYELIYLYFCNNTLFK